MRVLRDPATIRERCREILSLGREGRLESFRLQPHRLNAVSEFVSRVVRENHPSFDIPIHSRWPHFAAGGHDRWRRLCERHHLSDPVDRARAGIDLTVVSVLLDAGAGDAWGYRDAETGERLARSEGLAVASFRMFEAGLFSSSPAHPLRVDAGGLEACDSAALAAGFQVTGDNPLVGIDGRARLISALARALRARAEIFGSDCPRLGGMFDHLAPEGSDRRVPASRVLALVLDALGDIWPGRVRIGSTNLGDVWSHRAIRRADSSDGLVPFHKLSQWLVYSLVDPMRMGGIEVSDLDQLTGLAEYRNGGLFLDMDVIVPREPSVTTQLHSPGAELVVEWRALTVALLDQLAPLVWNRLGVADAALPVAALLEGGTWRAGRLVAAERRAGGGPPLEIASDGTVF